MLNEKRRELSRKRLNTISQIGIAAINLQLAYLEEIIALKSRFSELHKLDYYFEHETELLKLLNWG